MEDSALAASPSNEVEEAGIEQVDSGLVLVQGQGETEDDLQRHDIAAYQASLSASDWTVETLVSQLRKGRIDLNPHFQRRNAWVGQRQSRLVESVLLGYPIPQIVLAEREPLSGQFFVIDGKQRLLALRQFAVDASQPSDEKFSPLKLEGLKILHHLNGKTLSEVLASYPEYGPRFENHTIRTVFLSNWRSEDFLLSLFLRLNTGSVALSPQELRQALKPGPFTEWIDEKSINSLAIQGMLGNETPDRRMVDAELLLRHIAVKHSPLKYSGNLKGFLDDTTGLMNDDWESWEPIAASALEQLEAAIETASEVFPADALCRKWTKTRWERPFNRAIFDVIALSMSSPEVRDVAPENAELLVSEFQRLCDSSRKFSESITSTTKTAASFRTRIDGWYKVVRSVTGVSFGRPSSLY